MRGRERAWFASSRYMGMIDNKLYVYNTRKLTRYRTFLGPTLVAIPAQSTEDADFFAQGMDVTMIPLDIVHKNTGSTCFGSHPFWTPVP